MTDNESENVDDRAAAWAARMLSGSMTASEKAALDHWLAEGADHREAFAEYMDIADLAAGAVNGEGGGMAEDLLEKDLHDFAGQEEKKFRRYWYAVPPAIAASLAGALFFSGVFSHNEMLAESYETVRGQSVEIALSDGSRLTLNTDTAVEVRYSDSARQVFLTRGEALFEVARDSDKPFIVDALDTEVRVLGTTFNVRALGPETTISVLSGTVSVSTQAAENLPTDAITLYAGQEIQNAGARGFGAVYSIDTDTTAAWRRGKAYYDNEPLTDVIRDLNRYYAAPFVLSESTLSQIPVTGGFDIQNQDVAVEALSVALSLSVEKLPSGEILLSPAR